MSDDFINIAVNWLPEGQKTKEYYFKNVSSPQFHQALISFTEALNSENYQFILTSFGLNLQDAMGAKDGVEGFIKCILKKFPPKEGNKENNENENNNKN